MKLSKITVFFLLNLLFVCGSVAKMNASDLGIEKVNQAAIYTAFWTLISSSTNTESSAFSVWAQHQTELGVLFMLAMQSINSLQLIYSANYEWLIKDLENLYDQAIESQNFHHRLTEKEFDAVVQQWQLAHANNVSPNEEISQKLAQKNIQTFAEVATGDLEVANQLIKRMEKELGGSSIIQPELDKSIEDILEKSDSEAAFYFLEEVVLDLLDAHMKKHNATSLTNLLTLKNSSNSIKLVQTLLKYGPPISKAAQTQNWAAVLDKNKGLLNFALAIPYRHLKFLSAVGSFNKLEEETQHRMSIAEEIEEMYETDESFELSINPAITPFTQQCLSKEKVESLLALYRLIKESSPGFIKETGVRASLRLAFTAYLVEIYKFATYLKPKNTSLIGLNPLFSQLEKVVPACGLILAIGGFIERHYRVDALGSNQESLQRLQNYFEEQSPRFETILALAMLEKIVDKQLNEQNHQWWIGCGKVAHNSLAVLMSWYLQSKIHMHGPIPSALSSIGIAFFNTYIASDLMANDANETFNKIEKSDALPEKVESFKKAIDAKDLRSATDFAIDIADTNPRFVSEFIITALLSSDAKTQTQMTLILQILGLTQSQIDDLGKAYRHDSKTTIDWLTKKLLKQ